MSPQRASAGPSLRLALAAALVVVPILLARPLAAQDTNGLRLAELDPHSVENVHIILTITRAASPYEEVQYELRNRGSTLLLSLTKRLAGGFGVLDDVSLLSMSDLPAWWSALGECNLDSLPEEIDPAPDAAEDPETHYDLVVELGDYRRHSAADVADLAPDTPLWCASELIVEAYRMHGDPVPFQNLFFEPGEYGELSTETNPPARLFVDGRDTGLMTPIRGLRLLPGTHELRFINAEQAIDRVYEATVVVGLTTQLTLELR